VSRAAAVALSLAGCASPTATPATPTAAPAPSATAPAPGPEPAPAAPTATATTPTAASRPLPAGTVVLHVGDSMADALGKPLKNELAEHGVKGVLEAKEATFIPQWAGFSMGLRELIAVHQPDLVIVTLGGNEVRMKHPDERAEPVRRIVEAIGDRPCVWVATPLVPDTTHTGILGVIQDNKGHCRWFDTNALLPDLERLGDKVHPTIPERRRWARYLVRWLAHNRDPEGRRPWDLKASLEPPPPEAAR
jgi:lysophospholipase L1-like esterase